MVPVVTVAEHRVDRLVENSPRPVGRMTQKRSLGEWNSGDSVMVVGQILSVLLVWQ